MAGIFSGFEKLGLGNIGKEQLFEDPKKKTVEVKKEQPKLWLFLIFYGKVIYSILPNFLYTAGLQV